MRRLEHTGNPSRLRRRLVLQKPVALAGGGRMFETVAVVWAALTPVVADWETRGGHVEGVTRWRVVVRPRDDVAAGWRCLDGERVFTVLTSAPEDATNRYLALTVEEEGR